MSNFVYAQYKPDSSQVTEAELLPYKQSFTVAQTAVASTVTGTTAETTLANIPIPGGVMGPNGLIRVTTSWNINANSVNAKTAKLYFGGVLMMSIDMASQNGLHHQFILRNRGTQQAQSRSNSLATSFGFIGHSMNTVDTSLDQVVSLRGQLGVAGDSITLEAYSVEVLPG